MKYKHNSSKNLSKKFIFILPITVLVLGIGLHFLKSHKPSPQIAIGKPETINDIVINSVKDEPVVEKPITGSYATQINSGQNYLLTNFDQIHPFERLFLDYLQRKFSLISKFNGSVVVINPPAKDENEDALQFKVYQRIAYPNKLVDKLPYAKNDTTSQMLMEAVYCDRIKLPNDFANLVDTNIKAGGYNLTHVVLELHFLRDNNCAFFSYSEDQQIRYKIADPIAALATNPATSPDQRYEAIAFLMDMDRRELVQKAWLDKIISEQQPDGGWKSYPDDPKGNDHTTILALWALLEYSNPDLKYQPIIRH